MHKIDRPLTLNAVVRHRREECTHYECCLEEASALLWPSFSCEGCRLFSQRTNQPLYCERASSPLAWEV